MPQASSFVTCADEATRPTIFNLEQRGYDCQGAVAIAPYLEGTNGFTGGPAASYTRVDPGNTGTWKCYSSWQGTPGIMTNSFPEEWDCTSGPGIEVRWTNRASVEPLVITAKSAGDHLASGLLMAH